MTEMPSPRRKGPLAELFAPLRHIVPGSRDALILLTLTLLLGLWAFAIVTFGIPALVWPLVAIVPGVILTLVVLTWGM